MATETSKKQTTSINEFLLNLVSGVDGVTSDILNDIKTKWLEDFKNFARPDGVYILIGNKVDLKESRAVSFEEGNELAKKIDASDFFETSAKYGQNVQDSFKKLAVKVLKKFSI